METLDLTKRTWSFIARSALEWSPNSLLGSPVVIHWKGEYEDDALRQIAKKKYGRLGTKCPYEALVVEKLPEADNYLVLYSYGDVLEEQVLTELAEDAGDWGVLNDLTADNIDGLPLLRWSGKLDTSKTVETNILTRPRRYVGDERSTAIC